MEPNLPCILRTDSQITGWDEKIVSISHQKLEQPIHGTILSMMLTVISVIGLSLSVKLQYFLAIKYCSARLTMSSSVACATSITEKL